MVVLDIKHSNSKRSAVSEMGNRLVTTDMGRKVGATMPLSVGAAGSHLTH